MNVLYVELPFFTSNNWVTEKIHILATWSQFQHRSRILVPSVPCSTTRQDGYMDHKQLWMSQITCHDWCQILQNFENIIIPPKVTIKLIVYNMLFRIRILRLWYCAKEKIVDIFYSTIRMHIEGLFVIETGGCVVIETDGVILPLHPHPRALEPNE